ncbi:hypothetical protein REC12_26560 [Desulfosporosinus sp. PR]|uniref:hypothetical protein n=1 Tax=Candidatus Desulfosporosinus nitrosoreducens TaxID=3401928 RepID=UPI0027FBF16F|nr:hypothetical protein [Desulfosporosinus sp. PR]MDQ7097165.1 hypothetical protein [Desulfosporosinus sp. PR]
MKFKSSLVLKIGAALAIIISLSWCLYVIGSHGTGGAAAQSTRVQGYQDIGQNNSLNSQNSEGGSQGPSSGGQISPQGQNQFKSMPGDGNGDGSRVPGNGRFKGRPSGQGGFPMAGGKGSSTGSNYSVQIVVYSLLFFLAVLAVYFALARRKAGKRLEIPAGNRKLLVVTLFCVGFLLRIALGIMFSGHSSDLSLFRSWATSAANNLAQFYSGRNSSDYPPLYIYVLYIIGKAGSFTALNPYFTILLKLPSILADMGTALLLAKLARKYLSAELSILAAAFYIFNPAVFVNSTIWGQVDSFFTLIVMAGIVLLTEEKPVYSSIFFTAAVLMKPQGIIFLPVLFFELVKRRSLKTIVQALLMSALAALLIVFPFSSNLNVFWIIKLFTSTLGEYPYASVNAFNLFYLLGANYANDSAKFFLLSYHAWGMIFIVLTTLIAWFVFARGKGKTFAAAAALILIAGVFIFSTRMHERYLFPAVALAMLAWIYLQDKRIILLAAGFSVTSFVNTYSILCQSNNGGNQAALSFIPLVTSVLNVGLFLYLLKIMVELSVKKSRACKASALRG